MGVNTYQGMLISVNHYALCLTSRRSQVRVLHCPPFKSDSISTRHAGENRALLHFSGCDVSRVRIQLRRRGFPFQVLTGNKFVRLSKCKSVRRRAIIRNNEELTPSR